MKKIEVDTKKELKRAQEEGYEEIIIRGEMAKKLKKASKIMKLSKVGLGVLVSVLGVGVATAPLTGGISTLVAAPVAAMTGLEIAAIIAASAIGVSLIIAIFKDYEEISFEEGKLILRKKQKKN